MIHGNFWEEQIVKLIQLHTIKSLFLQFGDLLRAWFIMELSKQANKVEQDMAMES